MKGIILLAFLLPAVLFGQAEEGFEELFEDAAQSAEAMPDGLELLSVEIERLAENPISLRNAWAEDIMVLPGFSFSLADSIIAFAKSNPILSFDGLASHFSLNPNQKLLLYYCTELETSEREFIYPKASFRLRNKNKLSETKGFRTGKYKGDPLDLYQRFRANYGNFQSGYLADKDAGETSIRDFESFYGMYKSRNINIVLGDYYLETGMGSLLWKNFGLRKGAETMAPLLDKANGIAPAGSTVEFSSFRGIAGEANIPLFSSSSMSIKAWGASTPRSGTIDTNGAASSVVTGGYFRTDTELSKKNAIKETSAGYDLQVRYKKFTLGNTSLYLNYDKEIRTQSSSAFSGKEGILSSVYSSYEHSLFTAQAEFALDAKKNPAAKAAFTFRGDSIEAGIGFRHFSDKFRSPFGYMFGEFSYPANETGVYIAGDYMMSGKLRLRSYLDLFQTPERTYTVPEPVNGFEWLFQIDYKLLKNLNLLTKLVYEQKIDADKFGGKNTQIYTRGKINLRGEAAYFPIQDLRLRFRLELIKVNYNGFIEDEIGGAGFVDAEYLILKDLKLKARFSYFETPSYNAAIWQYEYSMPGLFRSVPLYGTGKRAYLGAEYTLYDFISIYGRFAFLTKNGVDKLYSGNDEIEGNIDSRVELQLEVKL